MEESGCGFASIAETAGFLAQFAVLLVWDAMKVLALVACGAVVIGVPLVAAYRWAGGSPLRYTGAAAVAIATLIYVPDRLLRWHRKWRAHSTASKS